MTVIEVVIHGVGSGPCALSGKEGEGLTVSFKDGTITQGFLSHKAFLQLVKMKFARQEHGTQPQRKTAGSDDVPAAIPVNVE
jgi:hypothetical protein